MEVHGWRDWESAVLLLQMLAEARTPGEDQLLVYNRSSSLEKAEFAGGGGREKTVRRAQRISRLLPHDVSHYVMLTKGSNTFCLHFLESVRGLAWPLQVKGRDNHDLMPGTNLPLERHPVFPFYSPSLSPSLPPFPHPPPSFTFFLFVLLELICGF